MRRTEWWIGALIAVLVFGASGCGTLERAQQGLQENRPRSEVAGRTVPPAPQPASARGGSVFAQASLPAPASGPLSVREVAERVKPAVVQIVTDQGTARDPTSGRRGRATGIGSGAIVDTAGRILTNYHVVANAQNTAVALPDGRTFDARLVGTDADTDLAVIQISGDNLPVAPLGDSDQLAVGDGLVAIGNALGLPGGPTVTAGVVSAMGRTVQEPSDNNADEPGAVLYDVIQTDAAINPGNSGGPLVNMYGQVVGINTMVAALAEPGVPAQGIGFAIAINTAKPIADQLVSTGRAIHPYLGIQYQWAGGASARQLRGESKRGVLVQRVVNGSPAAKAGLQRGDLITQVNGQPLNEESLLSKEIQKRRPGDSIQLTFERDSAERTVSVTLAEKPRS
jgi:S1-C subfamily serine protease